MKKRAAWLAATALLTGCASVDLERSGRQSLLFAGGVKVDVPKTYGEVRAIDVSTLGLGADGSFFIGWRRGRYVFVRPGECAALVVIRAKIEAEHALKIIEAMKGEKLCIVDFGGSLPSP